MRFWRGETNGRSERVLILGSGRFAQEIVDALQASHEAFHVSILDDRGDGRTLALVPDDPPGARSAGLVAQLRTVVDDLRPDRIIVALRERRNRLPMQDLLRCYAAGIVVEDGTDAFERVTGRVPIDRVSPSTLLFSQAFCRPLWRRALHRTVSVFLSVGLLLVGLAFMAVIAILIRLDTPGPALFVQDRIGFRGRPFRMYKFRTMRDDPPSDDVWNRDDNGRVTRVGAWLRRFHLDELPQLFNVIRGDMDLVGPRPEMAANVPHMSDEIPYYQMRSMIRPGITGWAQIWSGYAVTQEEVHRKLQYDLYYVKHRSLGLDFRILAGTLGVMSRNGHVTEASTIPRLSKDTLRDRGSSADSMSA